VSPGGASARTAEGPAVLSYEPDLVRSSNRLDLPTELMPSGFLSRIAPYLGIGIAAAGILTSMDAAAVVRGLSRRHAGGQVGRGERGLPIGTFAPRSCRMNLGHRLRAFTVLGIRLRNCRQIVVTCGCASSAAPLRGRARCEPRDTSPPDTVLTTPSSGNHTAGWSGNSSKERDVLLEPVHGLRAAPAGVDPPAAQTPTSWLRRGLTDSGQPRMLEPAGGGPAP
jgi:hypothetical protein